MSVMLVVLMGAANCFFLIMRSVRDNYCKLPNGDPCEAPDWGGLQHWNTYRSDNKFYDTIFVRLVQSFMWGVGLLTVFCRVFFKALSLASLRFECGCLFFPQLF
jgi:hypothetical protein